MSHIPIVRKRHCMLPKAAAQDVWTECAHCGENWPCEVIRLRDRIEVALALIAGPVDPPDTHPRILMDMAARALRGEDDGTESETEEVPGSD